MSHPKKRLSLPSCKFNLEQLEPRTVLSSGPTLDLSGLHLIQDQAETDHILVQFEEGHSPVLISGTSLGQALPLVPNLYQVYLSDHLTVEDALHQFQSLPGVVHAESNALLELSWTPNDPSLTEQWNLRNTGQSGGTLGADIRATAAWGVTIGSRRTAVAVMDSGIDYTHPDLYLNIWINQKEIPATRRVQLQDIDRDGIITFRDLNNPLNQGVGKITDLNGNGYIDAGDLLKPMIKDTLGRDTGLGGWADGISQDGDSYIDDLVGWNFNAQNNNPFDDYGHGSHVAGIIGAVGNNALGVAGINWQVQLVPVKFFNNAGRGTISMFIEGLDWALSKGIKISNNSWNDSGGVSILRDAIARARAQGHLFVAAAGNNSRNADVAPAYPAGFDLDNIVSVAATDRYDKLASFSNYGINSVTIAAPGVDIFSTNPNKSYGKRSGTSMATPHVTGAVALIWGLRPEWTYRQVIDWLQYTADRVPGIVGKVASGRLNLGAAVRVPPRGTPLPTMSSVSSVSTQTAASSVSLTSAMLSPSSYLRRGTFTTENADSLELLAEVLAFLQKEDQVFPAQQIEKGSNPADHPLP